MVKENKSNPFKIKVTITKYLRLIQLIIENESKAPFFIKNYYL